MIATLALFILAGQADLLTAGCADGGCPIEMIERNRAEKRAERARKKALEESGETEETSDSPETVETN